MADEAGSSKNLGTKNRPSAKRSRSRVCSINGCSNGDYVLSKWKEKLCLLHNCTHGEPGCCCEPPFRLFTFPTKVSQTKIEERIKWRKLVNRQEPNSKLWTPKKQSRVCSEHFPDKEPTTQNPYPTLQLGYDATKVKERLLEAGTKRRRKKLFDLSSSTKQKKQDNRNKVTPSRGNTLSTVEIENTESVVAFTEVSESTVDNNLDDTTQSIVLPNEDETDIIICFSENKYADSVLKVIVMLASLLCIGSTFFQKSKVLHSQLETANKIILILKKRIDLLKRQNNILKKKSRLLQNKSDECFCCKPLHEQLLNTPANVKFFTGLSTLCLFEKLHDFIFPYVRRRWEGYKRTSTKQKRLFVREPKRMGPKRKLSTKDEFLMMLMRLRLGLLVKDLSHRFKVSTTLSSRIISSWLRSSALVLKSLVFIPDQGTLNVTKPNQFIGVSNLNSIIDGTELFIQTPKDHKLQKITWSNYKHHNTLKILVGIAANSSIVFVSKAYSGNISDKELTVKSNFLDLLEPYTTLMTDKGFSIIDECTARRINLLIPPGKRGKSQMTPTELAKTNKIAKMRIIVEQVIRQLKCFRIISNELPILALSQIDDIVIVCAALTNFLKPIY